MPIAPVSKVRPPGVSVHGGSPSRPDGARLAVGYHLTPKVDVLEVKGNTLEPAYSPDTSGVAERRVIDFRMVAWSSDGRFLYAGGGYRLEESLPGPQVGRRGPGTAQRPARTGGPTHSPHPHSKTGGMVFCSRDGSFGMINDRDEAILLSPRAIPIYTGNHEGFLLSPDGSAIQFAYERRGKSPALFSVNERRLTDASSNLWAGLKASFTFQAPITKGLEMSDWDTSLSPKLKGKSPETETGAGEKPGHQTGPLGVPPRHHQCPLAFRFFWNGAVAGQNARRCLGGEHQWQGRRGGPGRWDDPMVSRLGRRGRSWPFSPILTASAGSFGRPRVTTTPPPGARTSSAGM